MIKNVIKRLFPKLDTVKEEKILKIFGPAVLQPNLWHINKKSVSRGFAIGAFCAFIPIPGVQMILAAFLSITFFCRKSSPICCANMDIKSIYICTYNIFCD